MKITKKELEQFNNLHTIVENCTYAKEEYFEKLSKKYYCDSDTMEIDLRTGEIK